MARTPDKTSAPGAYILAACALAIGSLTAHFEGLITHPNPDPGNPKLQQVCYGDTEVPMRTYTADECAILLKSRQAKDYAPKVLECVPGFADPARKYAFAASIDASYNAGYNAFCKSRMAKAFNAGQWKQGCELFRGWYVYAGGKKLRGLVRRREAEATLCARI